MASTYETDLAFALQLQQQYNKETSLDATAVVVPTKRTKEGLTACEDRHNVTDELLELLDPTPDVYALFQEFDRIYFWGKLKCCEVKWSPRMTLCAGLCHYEGRGGLCSIRLSGPLLKLRPRKDLVQTLLHEMIHAYLFVTHNNKDHNAHGPEFLKHMHRINKLSGANITVYHSFHDEVDTYRQHWWQCDGPCKNRRPYFGFVKRAMNRAPGPNDKWWDEHKKTCNGVFTKIRGPEIQSNTQKRKLNNEVSSPGTWNTQPSGTAGSFEPFIGKGHVLGKGNFSSKRSPTDQRENIENFLKRVEKKNNVPTKSPLKPENVKNPLKNKAKSPVKPANKIKQMQLDSYVTVMASNSTPMKSSRQESMDALLHHHHPNITASDRLMQADTYYDAFSASIDDDVEICSPPKTKSSTTVQCPVCQQEVLENIINVHLDQCIS